MLPLLTCAAVTARTLCSEAAFPQVYRVQLFLPVAQVVFGVFAVLLLGAGRGGLGRQALRSEAAWVECQMEHAQELLWKRGAPEVLLSSDIKLSDSDVDQAVGEY